MMTFSAIQFPTFEGTVRMVRTEEPSRSEPDEKAVEAFRRAYERPEELPAADGSQSPFSPAARAEGGVRVAGVTEKVLADAPRTASGIVLEAASAVADALLVTPSLMHGEGEALVQLKPDVLDGSRLRIQVTGRAMQVDFEPVTPDVARLLTEAQTQLVQHLTARIPTFEFAVTVRTESLTGRRAAHKVSGNAAEEVT